MTKHQKPRKLLIQRPQRATNTPNNKNIKGKTNP